MIDLEQLEQSLLEGARRDLAPAASDRLRVQSALLRGEAWWQSAAPPTTVLRKLTRSFRGGMVIGLALGAVAGGVVGGVIAQGVSRSHAHLDAAAPQRTPSISHSEPVRGTLPSEAVARGVPNATGVGEVEADTPVEPPGPPAGTVEAPHLAGHAALGSASRRASGAGAAHAQRSSLAEELSLLSRARRALNRSDASLALGIVASLDERFPNGVLMEERTATRILCLCELGRRDEAQAYAQQFLAQHPASVYAGRVRASCAGGQ